MAAEDCHLDGQRCYSEQPVLCRGTACTAALLLTAEGCVLAALCVRERVIGCTYVCGRLAADMCKVLVAAEAGSVRKDGKTALILAAMADQETPRLRPAHRGHCSRGVGTEAQIRQPR